MLTVLIIVEQKSDSAEILVDREELSKIPDFIPFKELTGYYERDGRKHYMKLDISRQKGSNEFLDIKTIGTL